MTLKCYKNGKEIALKDSLDLDFIEYYVIEDYLKIIGHLETNPSARIEIDLTEPLVPKYNIINCSTTFTNKINQIINRENLAIV